MFESWQIHILILIKKLVCHVLEDIRNEIWIQEQHPEQRAEQPESTGQEAAVDPVEGHAGQRQAGQRHTADHF